MKRRLLALAAMTFALVACSSSDTDQPQPRLEIRMACHLVGDHFALVVVIAQRELLLYRFAVAVFILHAALDKIGKDQADEIARLDRDSMVAVRDLRQLLESNQPASADIVAAGERLRGLRDAQFDRQVQMLAAERQVLTLQQWDTLQTQLQSRPRGTDNSGYPRRGGRGGMGGRGRWPGF